MSTWYFRECDKCYVWCKTDNPKEEQFRRDCPECGRPMKLLILELKPGDGHLALGKEISLPRPHVLKNH